MAWRTDAAMSRVLDQLIVYKEIHGEDGLIALLEQELAREHALKQRKQTRDLQDQIDLYADVLDFYASKENWRNTAGNKPSAALADRGEKARRALEAVAENGNGESEENGDD